MNEFLDSIDWDLLVQQKYALFDLIHEGGLSPSREAAVEGVLNLLDALQEFAVKQGVPA